MKSSQAIEELGSLKRPPVPPPHVPGAARALDQPLEAEKHQCGDGTGVLIHVMV